MTLVNIGELVKKLSQEFRASHAEMPWKEPAGLRDSAAHGYYSLRMEDIWTGVTEEIPTISISIRSMIGK